MDNLVSVIMPSYNTADYIVRSIQSVLDQTYKNWELIIIDDCSTDNTEEVVKPFLSDSRIHFTSNEKRRGAAVCRNKALKMAKGKWVAFLDSDDLWKKEKLYKQLRFMLKRGYHFSYTVYSEIDETGEPNGFIVSGPRVITKKGFYDYCWPGCLTVMYDREYIGLIQVADIKKNNDYAMWLKVCHKANCYLLNENLAFYRKGRQGSVSSHSIKTMIGWHYKLFREAEGRSAFSATLNTFRNLVFGLYKKKRYRKLCMVKKQI